MAYITLANTNKIIFESDLNESQLSGVVYDMKIFFLSKKEKNSLLAVQELFKNPEQYFKKIYKQHKPVDTFSFVHEGKKPSYHKFSCCPNLNADYQNFPIPEEIRQKGKAAIIEFREWFKSVEHLLEKPEVFVMRLKAKYGISENPKAITKGNSGSASINNEKIEDLIDDINELIKDAGRYYYEKDKHTKILKQFSKLTFLAYVDYPIKNNETGYSDKLVKQFLKEYYNRFKKPLIQKLIKYYSLKLNPEIKMEGYILEQLGFKKCSHCHKADYIPSKNES